MSINNRRGQNSQEQLKLFDTEPFEVTPGEFDIDRESRQAVSNAIRKSGKSRYQIAGEMSQLLASTVTEPMLNNWSAECRPGYQIPANKVAAFCRATGSLELIKLMLDPLGLRLAEDGEDSLSRVGELALGIKRMQKDLRNQIAALDQAKKKLAG
jgi:hypothetical protein